MELGPTAKALLEARYMCTAATSRAAEGDVVGATRLLFPAALGRGGHISEAARHLSTSAVMRTLMVCKQCLDAEQCAPGRAVHWFLTVQPVYPHTLAASSSLAWPLVR
jgi:hypothetical protein